ncbi:jun-like transcription factor [Coemansia sp. RSA 988]|nr:jun-like transcription factor [Coemansia sp. RSA 988]
MVKDASRRLAEIQSLLTKRGMERTAAILIAEAAQVGMRDNAVQEFLELAVAQEAIENSRDRSKQLTDPTQCSVDTEDSESGSSQSYKSANEEPAPNSSSKQLSTTASTGSSSSGSKSSSDTLSDSAEGTGSSSSSETGASSISNASATNDPPAKRSRLSEDTSLKSKINQVPTSTPASPGGKAQIRQQHGRRGKANKAPATPFCRIRPEDVVYADERLKDNTYISKGETTGDFGYKAHKDLIVTRGKAFTKEKNKKKRGSYSGGRITMTSHSIKFT